MKFSEKYGYKTPRSAVQKESMDESLRNGIWSLLHKFIWKDAEDMEPLGMLQELMPRGSHQTPIFQLCEAIWLGYFKRPIDTLDDGWYKVRDELREYFFCIDLDREWYEVYDFVEFVVQNYKEQNFVRVFVPQCNELFEREMSAYRFVGDIVTEITSEEEIDAIDEALKESESKDPIRSHLHRALELMSDRNQPDYRNSVKESISAVESAVFLSLGKKGTLGQLLKKHESELGLHSAMKEAFDKLYGYTSDEDGIRHAIMEEEKTDFEDAKFMLVACSAFVNFVRGKTST